jgi:hypothetical protein
MSHVHVLRIGRLTGKGIIQAAAKHNLREIQAERGAGSNIDAIRSKLNYVLRGHAVAASIAAMAQTLMDCAKVKPLRKDAVRGLEIIFSLSPYSIIEHSKFFPDCVAWTDRYFQVPILSATVHLDESAPHCHVLLLPLVDGRMIGSSLFGNRTKLQALQADFHIQVGQRYGLARQAAQKRHSAAVRREAADMVLAAIKVDPSSLDDCVMGLLRDCIAHNPEPLIQSLKLTMPRKQSKHKTFAAIMTQNKPERKPIGFKNNKPIGFVADGQAKIDRNLSCVGFQNSSQPGSPAVALQSSDIQEAYVRERDSEQAADYWDEVRGEFIKLPTSKKPKSAEIDRVRTAIEVMQR